LSNIQISITPVSLISNFKEITKIRLSVSVVFSSLAGYALGADVLDIKTLILLAIGGYCMVGASNAYNQIIEKDLDALMHRTQNRPIPSGRMSVKSAFIIAVILTLIGIAILYTINPKIVCCCHPTQHKRNGSRNGSNKYRNWCFCF